jgi:hypothetical protein
MHLNCMGVRQARENSMLQRHVGEGKSNDGEHRRARKTLCNRTALLLIGVGRPALQIAELHGAGVCPPDAAA